MKIKIYHYNVRDFVEMKKKSKNELFYEFELDIGFVEDSEKKTDRFSMLVCNIEGLNKVYNEYINSPKVIQFNHLMITEFYDEKKVIKLLNERIDKIEGNTWLDIVSILSVFLNYEFSPNIPDREYIW